MIKTRFSLFVIALLPFLQANGQIYIGLKSGLGASYIKSGFDEPFHKYGLSNPILSYSLAGCVNKPLSNRFEGSLELQVARKGYSYKIKNYFQSNEIIAYRTVNAASINFTISLILASVQKKEKTKSFSFINGIYTSLLTNNKWKYGGKETVGVDDSMKPFDMGIIAGLKFSSSFSKNKQAAIELRYYHGISDVSSAYEKTKFRCIEFLVSYLLPLHQKSNKRPRKR